jgi:hypothetical protein
MYPATYVFSIPNTNNLVAYKRYGTAEPWIKIPERFSNEFFNGIEAARFDYAEGKAYVSVAFTSYSDHIYIKIEDSNGDLPTTFHGISEFYDNRKVSVTCTIDDVEGDLPQAHEGYSRASKVFSDAKVWWTAGIVTQAMPNWTLYQEGLNMGYLEIASHSRTHPDVASEYGDYDGEIGGSKQDIVDNLDLPFKKDSKEYVWCWIEPSGYSDEIVRQKLGKYKYLISRTATGGTNSSTPWAEWDSANNHYSRADTTIFMDFASLQQLNSAFDKVYASGGIYHFWGHVEKDGWAPGETAYQHIQYIKGHSDVWYVSFGQMYVYHHIQNKAQIR